MDGTKWLELVAAVEEDLKQVRVSGLPIDREWKVNACQRQLAGSFYEEPFCRAQPAFLFHYAISHILASDRPLRPRPPATEEAVVAAVNAFGLVYQNEVAAAREAGQAPPPRPEECWTSDVREYIRALVRRHHGVYPVDGPLLLTRLAKVAQAHKDAQVSPALQAFGVVAGTFVSFALPAFVLVLILIFFLSFCQGLMK